MSPGAPRPGKSMTMITIDGGKGEGGGQVLRSALSLSACTGQPFRIRNIRAGRKKPGLMRQHLTAVDAAAQTCGGKATGAMLGSGDLTFTPGEPRGGSYRFDIGTAGATTLVFQTILPILMVADEPSQVHLTGGTHVMSAPSLDFLTETFLPAVTRIGAKVCVESEQTGFYPAGGGRWSAQIAPCPDPQPLDLMERGELASIRATALRSHLSGGICERELETIGKALGLPEEALRHHSQDGAGPGNAVLISAAYANHCEVFCQLGRMGLKAESVAKNAVFDARTFMGGLGAVSVHMADQLLLPLALFGGGRFSTVGTDEHFRTNAEVIGMFVDVAITAEEEGGRTVVTVKRR